MLNFMSDTVTQCAYPQNERYEAVFSMQSLSDRAASLKGPSQFRSVHTKRIPHFPESSLAIRRIDISYLIWFFIPYDFYFSQDPILYSPNIHRSMFPFSSRLGPNDYNYMYGKNRGSPLFLFPNVLIELLHAPLGLVLRKLFNIIF